MIRTDRFGTADLLLVFLCLNLASAVRFGYLATYADWGRAPGPLVVADVPAELPDLIKHWADDNVFACRAPLAAGVERTAHAGPAYSWLVAKLQAWLPAPADRGLRFLQAEMGAFTAMLYYLIAFRAWGNRAAAILAGLFCSFHLPWVAESAQLTDGSLTAFLLAFALWLAGRVADDGGPISGLLLGLALAGLSLTRAELLVFALGAMVWTVWQCRLLKRGWLPGVLLVIGLLGGLAPWVYRNYQEFDRTENVVDSAPLRYAVGMGPGATGAARSEAELVSSLAKATGEAESQLKARLEALPQRARYLEVGRIAWDAPKPDPVEAVHQRITAFLGFWLGSREPWLRAAGAPAPPDWFAPTMAIGLAAMLLLALLGWRLSYAHRGPVPVTLTPILVALPYVLTYTEPLSGPRLPLDGLLLSLAGYAVACLLPRVGPLAPAAEERPRVERRPVPPPPPAPPPSSRPPGGGYAIKL